MATVNLQRFTRVESLRAIQPELPGMFLMPYNDFFLARRVDQDDYFEKNRRGRTFPNDSPGQANGIRP